MRRVYCDICGGDITRKAVCEVSITSPFDYQGNDPLDSEYELCDSCAREVNKCIQTLWRAMAEDATKGTVVLND